jgi:hypothetical protein
MRINTLRINIISFISEKEFILFNHYVGNVISVCICCVTDPGFLDSKLCFHHYIDCIYIPMLLSW